MSKAAVKSKERVHSEVCVDSAYAIVPRNIANVLKIMLPETPLS